MINVKSFLLPTGRRVGTAKLADKKNTLKKEEISKYCYFFDMYTI